MSWYKQTIVDKEVIIDVPVRVWFHKWGTPEYWAELEKRLNSEINELQEFIRDHRSRDHYSIYVRDVHETVCDLCGYSYGNVEDCGNLIPTCCEEAMQQVGVNFV